MLSGTAQSSHPGAPRPAARAALLLLFLGATTVPAGAQSARTARAAADNAAFYGEPGGTRLARLNEGAQVAVGSTRGDLTEVTLEGWIYQPSVTADRREGHTLRVTRSPEENLRGTPSGIVVAQVVAGMLLDEIERRDNWVHVRRRGYVPTRALAGLPTASAARSRDSTRAAAPAAPRPAATAQRPAAESVATQAQIEPGDPRRGVARRRLQVFGAPDSSAIGSIEAGAPLRVTERVGDWVRVETQGWVRASEVRLADAGILGNVTAAELRRGEDEFVGRMVRWTVQFIALQTADELRTDFRAGQRYILARGPAPEYAFVYIIVPQALLARVEQIEPLASVGVVARVVSGRSAYLANPILELVELQP